MGAAREIDHVNHPRVIADEQSVLLLRPDAVVISYERIQTRLWRRIFSFILLSALISFVLIHFFEVKINWPELPVPLKITPQSVAVIGAGPAGISFALTLQKLAKESGVEVNITILEATERAGGKLAVGANVFPYDDDAQDPISAEEIAGSSILHDNFKAKKAAEGFLGREFHYVELPSHEAAFFDGEKFVASITRPDSKTSWSRWSSLSWQYGPFVVRSGRNLLRDVKAQLQKLSEGNLDSGTKELLKETGNADYIIKTAQVIFDAYKLTPEYQHEILDPQIRRMLGMAPRGINALQVAAAMAAEDITEFSTEDTMAETFEDLAANLEDIRFGHRVTAISRVKTGNRTGNWSVEYLSGHSFTRSSLHFDQVVLTAPELTKLVDKTVVLNIDDVESEQTPFYQPTFVTFFATRELLDPALFGAEDALPKQVLFIDTPQLGPFAHVSELSHVRSLVRTTLGVPDGEGHLYRFVSTSGNPQDLLSELARNDQNWKITIDWSHTFKIEHGYPLLYPQTSFPSFELNKNGLWRTSVIDSVGTSLDLSWMAGEAVAKNVINHIMSTD